MDKEINICFITDNNYIMPTYISALSVKLSKYNNTKVKAYIVGYKIDEKNVKVFDSLKSDDFEVVIINKNSLDIKDLSNEFIKLYSPAIFLKLELEKILSDCTRVLFLDSDIIVTKDLSDMYNTDLYGYYIAACRDILPVLRINYLKPEFIETYFNVGVMLLNLDLIRNDKFFDKAKKHYIDFGNKYIYPEQDTLSYIIGEKLKIISPIYNWTVINSRYNLTKLKNFFKLSDTKEIEEDNIAIFHYAGLKPWKHKETPYKKYWLEVYNQSIYKDEKLNQKNKYNVFSTLYIKFRMLYRSLKFKNYYKQIGFYK